MKLKSPISATISDAEYNGSDFEDLFVTQTDAVNTFNKDAGAAGTNGTGDEFVWSKQYGSDSHWLETGVTTNLPLNGTTKYSLELKLKKVNENVEGIGIVLSYPGKNSNSQGIYFCDDKITGFQKTTTDMYPVVGSDDEKSLSYDGIWTKNLTDDGYTVVNLYIEGTKVSVMVGGVMLGAFDFVSYTSPVLSIGVKCQILNALEITPKVQLASVKDVTVKAGALKDTRLYMQYTEVSEGKQSVRFISTLDSLEGTEAGFKITAVYKDAQGNIKNDKSWEKKVNVVYNSIIAEGDTYTAYDLGGRYLFAVSVNGVPTYEQIDFYVQSYVVVDGQTKWSEVERFTMGDGAELKGAEKLEIPAN